MQGHVLVVGSQSGCVIHQGRDLEAAIDYVEDERTAYSVETHGGARFYNLSHESPSVCFGEILGSSMTLNE